MKRVSWRDKQGDLHWSLLRDQDDESQPEFGVPLMPPPIEEIIKATAHEVQTRMIEAGLLTYRDLERYQPGLTAILNNLIARKIVLAYRDEEIKGNG